MEVSNTILKEHYVDVSVIIPVYNSLKTIERAVESVALQVDLPREVIIVDDCSTDTRVKDKLTEIKDCFSSVLDIKVIYLKKNVGAGSARNAGWNIAKGKYIAFLDSDDVWHPQKIRIQYKIMEECKGVALCAHKLKLLKDEELNDYYGLKFNSNSILIKMSPIKKLFKHYPCSGTPSIMLKNTKGYRFQEGKRYSEDYLLWLEILFNNDGVYIENELGAVFKELYGAGGLSGNLWEIEKGELETFSVLKRKGHINIFTYMFCSAFSILKYVKRVFVCYLRAG